MSGSISPNPFDWSGSGQCLCKSGYDEPEIAANFFIFFPVWVALLVSSFPEYCCLELIIYNMKLLPKVRRNILSNLHN